MLRWGLKSNTSGSSDGERLPRKHLEYQPVKLRFINNVEKTRNQGRFVGKVPRENFLYGSSIEVSVCLEGGYDTLLAEYNEKLWKQKTEQFMKRNKTKLPKWFGERPGKKPGDPNLQKAKKT